MPTPIKIDCPNNRYLHRPVPIFSPVPHLLCHRIHLPTSLLTLYPLFCISTATIICNSSPPPTLSIIPIIPHLYRFSIVILPHLFCSTHCIFLHCPAHLAAIVCLTFQLGSSLDLCRSILHYTAHSALLHTNFITICSDLLTTLLYSVLAHIFSLCVMFLLHSNMPHFSSTCLHSAMLKSDHSTSALSTLICLIHLCSDQL